ncbi:hypothetical protein CTAYLR_010084 [Chrysophaeum taylorii]|uniref:HSF-type DNA-binding domain-containing protein n=1 Tax=Chrysophaeum taylorii TaxID=2483200 RepID=A0AAD7UC76_9STRA|nr:hypothetical protein CTAYLR_010084 [Chrysophaeum taylorii]
MGEDLSATAHAELTTACSAKRPKTENASVDTPSSTVLADSSAIVPTGKTKPSFKDAKREAAKTRVAKSLVHSATDKPPDFVVKLYSMFTELGPDLITWNSGKIAIPGPSNKLAAVLPKYFRHGKFTSFQRQLNNFGFHKKISESSSKLRVYSREDMIGYPAEALLDLRRTPGAGCAAWRRSASKVKPPDAPLNEQDLRQQHPPPPEHKPPPQPTLQFPNSVLTRVVSSSSINTDVNAASSSSSMSRDAAAAAAGTAGTAGTAAARHPKDDAAAVVVVVDDNSAKQEEDEEDDEEEEDDDLSVKPIVCVKPDECKVDLHKDDIHKDDVLFTTFPDIGDDDCIDTFLDFLDKQVCGPVLSSDSVDLLKGHDLGLELAYPDSAAPESLLATSF